MRHFPFVFSALLFLSCSVFCCHPSPADVYSDRLVQKSLKSAGSSYLVPASPFKPEQLTCRLDLSEELFGGVKDACGGDLDRSRCCPVLEAWLFAAHARSALEIQAPSPAPSPLISSSVLPMMPDDSQKCVELLRSALQERGIILPSLMNNGNCDTILCFCNIRLHNISSLSCPAAFNVSGNENAIPMPSVRNLEKNCKNSSYAGCTKCLGALQKINVRKSEYTVRANKMLSRDCQLMGLTWLLIRNKTAYIPTVSAVLRAMIYSAHPPSQNQCSPDQENMPLAVNSLHFQHYSRSSSSSSSPPRLLLSAFRPSAFFLLPVAFTFAFALVV